MGYMLMQAYDFVWLKDHHNCVLQIGGSDQWANIVAGVELGRKLNNKDGKEVEVLYGMTCPLLVKADGEKMGKTASGTWVSRNKLIGMTSTKHLLMADGERWRYFHSLE